MRASEPNTRQSERLLDTNYEKISVYKFAKLLSVFGSVIKKIVTSGTPFSVIVSNKNKKRE